jgi:hypothetical protein
MGASKSNSSSSTAEGSGGEDLEPFAPSTPTPQNLGGGLFRTPPKTTLAVDSSTATKRKGKGKAAAAPVFSDPRRMDDRTRGASSGVEPRRPTHSEQQSNDGEEEDEEEKKKKRRRRRGYDCLKNRHEIDRSRQLYWVGECYQKKVRGLGAIAALEGRREAIKNRRLYDIIDRVVSEMVIDAVLAPMKAELQSKTAAEAFTLLKNRYSLPGVSSYCTVGMKLFALRQLPQQSI